MSKYLIFCSINRKKIFHRIMTKPFLQPNCYKCGVLLDIVIELYIKYLPCWSQCSVQRNVRTFGVLRRPLTTEQLANLTMCEPANR